MAAQTDDGTISGYVTDASGSAVPNAKIALRIPLLRLLLNSDQQRYFYTFRFVIPGTYEIDVEAAGFQREVHPEVIVQVAQSVNMLLPEWIPDRAFPGPKLNSLILIPVHPGQVAPAVLDQVT